MKRRKTEKKTKINAGKNKMLDPIERSLLSLNPNVCQICINCLKIVSTFQINYRINLIAIVESFLFTLKSLNRALILSGSETATSASSSASITTSSTTSSSSVTKTTSAASESTSITATASSSKSTSITSATSATATSTPM